MSQIPDQRTRGKNHTSVGTSHYGADDEAKVRGSLSYADDFAMEDMLHATVVRSEEPAASIESIETEAAREMDGVSAVLTASDVPNNSFEPYSFGQAQESGIHDVTGQILAEEEVRYVGEPIALVAANTENQAQRAAKRIDITYDPHKGVFDPEAAMEEDAPSVHGENNVIAQWRVREGDIEAGFDDADVIVENTYETSFQEHAHLEPESGVAWIDDDGIINLRVGTQVTEQYRDVADILDIPHSSVRIKGTVMGGGFGGKEDLTVEPFLGVLAYVTKSPVKLTYNREDMFIGRHKRSPYKLKLKHGAKKDGNIVAMKSELVSDSGAYVNLTPPILLYSASHATGPYHIPNIHVDAHAVLTNNTPGSAFRSFGAMEVTVGIEQQVDELAKELDISPLQLRKKNYIEGETETVTGQSIDSAVKLAETQAFAWDALDTQTQKDEDHIVTGQGIASSWQSYGKARYDKDTASAWISLERDGSAVVRCGIPDLGGGQRESLRQIVAEELGISVDVVKVVSTDSLATPLSGMVAATRGLFMSGQAVRKAAQTITDELTEAAIDLFSGPSAPTDITVADGLVCSDVSDEQKEISELIDLCSPKGRRLEALETFHAETADRFDGNILSGDIFADYTFSTQAAEVAVNTRTGVVTVTQMALAHDVGKAINPARVKGQIEGGALQGIGYTLTENYSLEDGKPAQRDLESYNLPTVGEAPEFTTIILESETGKGPYGAKGIGEPAITATAPAVLNAIADATGTRITELPADPGTVFTAIQESE